ncbi:MAG: tyrosine-protein kinase family protein, partial [Nitrospira sp.]
YASDSADDLAGETFADLLQELRSRYDVVLIDAPPFLAMASPSVLASKADAVVVIAAWGTTRREVLRYTLEQLRGLSPRVAGVVLNKVNLKKNGQYDYGDSTIFGTQSHKYYVS